MTAHKSDFRTKAIQPESRVPQSQGQAPMIGGAASEGLVQRQCALNNKDSVRSLQMLSRNLSSSSPTQMRTENASPASGGVTQLILNKTAAFPKFISDVTRKNVQGEQKQALEYLFTQAKQSPMIVDYDEIVSFASGNYTSTKKIYAYANDLTESFGRMKEVEVAGEGAHMFTKHLLVDKEYQEERIVKEKKKKVTRMSDKGGAKQKAVNFVGKLQKKALPTISGALSSITRLVYNEISDDRGAFQLSANNGARKAVLVALVAPHQLIAADGFSVDLHMSFDAVTAAGATIKIKPELESDRAFKKISTTFDVMSGMQEQEEMDSLKMYWGRNSAEIQITAAMSFDDAEKLGAEAIDQLGVTMF